MFIKSETPIVNHSQKKWSFENLQIMYDGVLGYLPEGSNDWVPFLPEPGKKYPASQVYALFDDTDMGRAVSIEHIMLELEGPDPIPEKRRGAYIEAARAAEGILEPKVPTHDYREPPPEPF